VRVRGARRRPQPRLPHRSGAGLPCDRGPRRLPELLARGSGCAWFQTPDPPADDVLDSSSEDDKAGDSFVPKIRTARCVASQVVPRSRTTPRSSSAPMAAARCRGDLSEVTVVVAQTRMYMAARVIATMSMVVTIEARIFFIRLGCDSDTANQRIAQTNSQLSLLAGRLSHLRTNSDSWRVPVRVKSRQQQQGPPRPKAPPTEPTSTQAAAHNPRPLTLSAGTQLRSFQPTPLTARPCVAAILLLPRPRRRCLQKIWWSSPRERLFKVRSGKTRSSVRVSARRLAQPPIRRKRPPSPE